MEPLPPGVVAAANARSRRLRELVLAPDILVMPGAYDLLSALLFAALKDAISSQEMASLVEGRG